MNDATAIEARTVRHFTSIAQTGNSPALVAAIREFAATHPSAATWQYVGAEMLRTGFTEPALYVLEAAVAQFPLHADLHYWYANALRVSGRPPMAEPEYREALRLAPQHRDAAPAYAFMLREQGRIEAATDVVLSSLRNREPDVAEVLAATNFLRECNAFVAANDVARTARERWPDNATVAATAGAFALAVGDFERARESLRAAVMRDPKKGHVWLRLATAQRFESRADPDIALMETAWRDASLDAGTHTTIGFALGKALDDVGDFKDASVVLREANDGAKRAHNWDQAAWLNFVNHKMNGSPIPAIDDDFAPIFVIGLPRTGTTLVATSLARDARIRDRGELNWIDAMHTHLVEQNHLRDAKALKTVANIVVAQMRRDDAPAVFYLDKNPLNFRYLDLIAAMFPRAKIIHCRRDARDTALSIWMQYFSGDALSFANDFAMIGEFMRGYEKLMAHWRAALKISMFDVDYETLVADPDDVLRKLGAFLGIELRSSNDSAGAIATASVWQARQPVYTRSIGRWRNYSPYLPELEANVR